MDWMTPPSLAYLKTHGLLLGLWFGREGWDGWIKRAKGVGYLGYCERKELSVLF